MKRNKVKPTQREDGAPNFSSSQVSYRYIYILHEEGRRKPTSLRHKGPTKQLSSSSAHPSPFSTHQRQKKAAVPALAYLKEANTNSKKVKTAAARRREGRGRRSVTNDTATTTMHI
jgi:hypothetical protein